MPYSQQEIQQHINSLKAQGLTGDALWSRVHQDSQSFGVTPQQIDQAMGFQAGESQGWINQNAPPRTTTLVPSMPNGQPQGAGQTMYPSMPNGLPQTGLAGSEAALRGGLDASLQSLQGGLTEAQDRLAGTQVAATDRINQGLAQGSSALSGMMGNAAQSIGQGVAGYQPYVNQGTQASGVQAALSGGMGPEAQAQAIANLQPVNEFQQQQGEQAVLRNAAALGGLGGGNVQKDLMRFGQGLATQNLNDQFGRLTQVAGQGLQGAQGIGNLQSQLASMQGNAGTSLLGANQQAGMNNANIATTLGGQRAANVFGAGQFGANLASNTAGQLSQGRTRAGEQLAGIQQQQGAGISDMLSGQNLANILMAAGQGGDSANLASLLANLATQQANMSTGQTSGAQFLNDQGIMDHLSRAASGAGGLMTGMG